MIKYDTIIRPVISEKTNIQKEANNQITFEVYNKANRVEIKKAIQSIFNVNVLGIRTVQIKGKQKQRGKIIGKRKDWKKAIVTLAPGDRIDFFEGV